MIQDTIYKRRLNDLPNLRIYGYHTYHIIMDKRGHGMVTIKKTQYHRRKRNNFCLMNHPQVWITINKTAIDLSVLPVDIVPLTDWSIYPGLLSDHLAVLYNTSTLLNSFGPKEMAHTTTQTGPRTHYDCYNKH